ncbi:hypothetical protein MY579_01055 [Haemophilus influenzae]|uniref:hypothetical protein n=1 Tax=Haemophilus influenzae TaxID=727 RepID=UPI0034DA1D9D
MALPFIIAGAAIAAGAFGVKKGVDAKNDLDDAERYQRWAKQEAEEANDKLENQKSDTQSSLENYGKTKKLGIEHINLFDSLICYPGGERKGSQLAIGRNVAEKLGRIVITKEEEIQILKKLHLIDQNMSVKDAEKKIKAERVDMEKMTNALTSAVTGSLAGLAASGGAYLGVGALATASTGTAISGLSGAAATNATLAWLGGGSLASGGLGMAGGMAVMGGLVAGPLLAIGGSIFASKAAEKKEEAYENWKKVEAAAEKLKVVVSKLSAIAAYTKECNSIFKALDEYWANEQLVKLQGIASRDVRFKDLSLDEKKVVYANYELRYVLNGLVYEPTMNETGDDVLSSSKREAFQRANKTEYTELYEEEVEPESSLASTFFKGLGLKKKIILARNK